jgi:hypothetical protein
MVILPKAEHELSLHCPNIQLIARPTECHAAMKSEPNAPYHINLLAHKVPFVIVILTNTAVAEPDAQRTVSVAFQSSSVLSVVH